MLTLVLLLSALFTPTAHAEPADVLVETIYTLQAQWKENERRYIEQQKSLEDAANLIRDQLCGLGELKYCRNALRVDVSSYNPVPAQTDHSPCIGANSTDICFLHENGERPIALSQDLVSNGSNTPFRYGDYVRLDHDTVKGCNGLFRVEDTMHSRWKLRADIFSPEASKNVGCSGAYLRKA